jgi:cytochrome oxidase Cu insertion factor (SCO1/SenC/PrrC family)
VSLTVSPLTDDVRALADYAGKFGLPKDWILLTGEPRHVEAWARHSLYSDITKLGVDGLPPHTERAFLIDRRHRIRGIYDARSPHEMVRLRSDIGQLRREEAPAEGQSAAASPSSPPEDPTVVMR